MNHKPAQPLTDGEIDVAWRKFVAGIATDALVTAKILEKKDIDRAQEIIAEEVNVRLVMGVRPERANWRFTSDPTSPKE
jgi:hypothetical protein